MTTETPGGGGGPPPATAAALDIYYAEATTAHTHLIEVIGNYRKNTTTLLAVATGAATFFGFADSAKGPLYVLALVVYALAAVLTLWIFLPIGLSTNMAFEADRKIDDGIVTAAAARADVLDNRLWAIRQAEIAITGIRGSTRSEYLTANTVDGAATVSPPRYGIAFRFRALIAAVTLTTILAGANTVVEKPATPTEPTHIIIDGGLP